MPTGAELEVNPADELQDASARILRRVEVAVLADDVSELGRLELPASGRDKNGGGSQEPPPFSKTTDRVKAG